MSVNFNVNKNLVNESNSIPLKKDKPEVIEKNIKDSSTNKIETLNFDKKNTIGQKASASISFVGNNSFINDSVNKIKDLLSDEKLTDKDEKEINIIFSNASKKNKLNELLDKLNKEKINEIPILEKVLLGIDRKINNNQGFIDILKGLFSSSEKQPSNEENNVTREDIFETIFKDKNLTYENGKIVADYLNKNYTGVGVVIGEGIQNNFLFLLMDNKPEKLSKGTLETAKYVFSNENLKPDHLQRVAVGKKILNDYLNGK